VAAAVFHPELKKGKSRNKGPLLWCWWLLLLVLKAAAVVVINKGGCTNCPPCEKTIKQMVVSNKGALLVTSGCF